MFQNLCLVFCALYVAQNPFLQNSLEYSPQIICFLVWTALLYKFAYTRGRAAREAEHESEMAQLVQHCENVWNTAHTVAQLSAQGCEIVWDK